MCEFCLKHGEGKKWYLEAKNYSEDLLSDIRSQKALRKLFSSFESIGGDLEEQLDRLDQSPGFVKRVLRWRTVRHLKKIHYGQVLPIEDVERIFDFVTSIVRVACICRQIKLGEEKRYCYGISMGPPGEGKLADFIRDIAPAFFSGPEAMGMEVMDKEEALSNFRKYETAGLCHTVWTFRTPFIGGICNCDRPDCLAMSMTLTHDVPVMFRAEYVAESDPDLCTGCRECMRVCQFGAISYSAAVDKIFIDPRQCYGCGICRSACQKDAIQLKDRAAVPLAADLW